MKELLDKINCRGCENPCCKKENVVIPIDREVENKIPAELKAALDEVPVMKSDENQCAAFNGSGCSIYENRPWYCKVWPVELIRVPFGYYGGEELDFVVKKHCCIDPASNEEVIELARIEFRKLEPESQKRLRALAWRYAT